MSFKKIMVIMLAVVCNVLAYGADTSVDSLMRRLDSVIAQRQDFINKKEARLHQIEDKVRMASSDIDEFDALLHLYDEYNAFNADSAYNISVRLENLARKIGDSELTAHAGMKKANSMLTTGMYHEALDLLRPYSRGNLPEYLHPYYYHLKRTLYGGMADYSAFEPEKREYSRLTNAYRDSIMSVNVPGTAGYVMTKADYDNFNGEPQQAIDLIKNFMSDNNLSEHDKAICAYILSKSYMKLGDTENQKEQLLISAIHDMESATREYIALRELALLLFEEGDLERAFKYMNIALDDASRSSSRQRIIEVNDAFPEINDIYVNTIQQQKTRLKWAIVVVAVLALLLLVLLFMVIRQMNKARKAKAEVEQAYSRLDEASKELQATNESLNVANRDIAEISGLKEVYIGQYMDQCVGYIEKLDTYRKSLGKLAGHGKTKELERALKSTTLVDDELKAFYRQFDRTFLSLFPTFVTDVNNLLEPSEAIIPKNEGSLNTDLRIFALIRLGITDSDRIARFLRCSVTTIYTYRTRIRNKARGDRNMLEAEVSKISR